MRIPTTREVNHGSSEIGFVVTQLKSVLVLMLTLTLMLWMARKRIQAVSTHQQSHSHVLVDETVVDSPNCRLVVLVMVMVLVLPLVTDFGSDSKEFHP